MGADERQEQRATLRRVLERAGETARLRRYSLAAHPSPAARAFGEDWLARYRAGAPVSAWLAGPAGTGKTGLAWSLARELVLDAVRAHYATPYEDRPDQPRPSGLFVIWRDLLDDLRQTFGRDPAADADPRQLLRRARRVPLLALDDLGAERVTGYALEQLAILVDQRYQQRLPTIVTSNYGVRDLARIFGRDEAVVGSRIVSRLIEGAVVLVLDGPSLRAAADG